MLHSSISNSSLLFLVAIGCQGFSVSALQQQQNHPHRPNSSITPPQKQLSSRRETLGWVAGAMAATGIASVSASPAWAASAVQDSMNVDNFLRSGVDAGGNMGVSSQAGKSKPETGVFLR